MALAVHFGAGKIGRGFIANLLHQTGYHVVFADVVQETIDKLKKEQQYTLFLIDHNYDEQLIDDVDAYSTINETDKVVDAIQEAEVVTTSVMATNLDKVAPLIAKGLKRRVGSHKPKITVMACENAMMGTNILVKAMLATGEITADELNEVGVYPNTAVDRVVFDGHHHGKDGIEIGDAYELAIEKNKLADTNTQPIKNAEYVENLEMYLQRKIYMINCGHAISAYLGQANGYKTVQEVLKDPQLLEQVKAAMMESAGALEKKYGFEHTTLVTYMNKMFVKRMTTPGLSDPVERVGREPIRKLAANDRIIGPALQCEAYKLANDHLLRGAAYGFHFQNPDDQQAVEIQTSIEQNGIKETVAKYTQQPVDSRIVAVISDDYEQISKG
ncbi:mannitol-1-phosphate 5-dehydrogenase [Lactiplantibacillus pentosus]|uniref:Mannitol dehydrogenase-like protein n=2 Tax=Lactiplantibacillus pentosus TaxID=1589 RepID=G0M4K0_LACPE|nr:mannitol-1-phosphate 5-dehydrogenase [Lactiplantibacillus pentosus]MCT3303362.1 mannitol-1-phosphate 5-dehydrogenase [Lactiplantibacillus pentosus]PRO93303.1 mannitol dehydrogenase [Lactiplantibacillus pentosus]CCC17126.1 mannitol dehydrogenase-like protein [Lactiplantibacillus pentosus IG1]